MSDKEKKEIYSKKALEYSDFYSGKVEIMPKVPIRSLDDFSVWYSPGVAEVSSKIADDEELSFKYTGRWNTIAIVTDGSRVLGLGNIGGERFTTGSTFILHCLLNCVFAKCSNAFDETEQ